MNESIKAVEVAIKEIGKVIIGKEEIVEKLFIALLSDGHVLLESVPGSGKTKLATSFAKILNGKFSRIQFTPDVLPSDVTGIQLFNPKKQEFELKTGPVVTNILLADEINRATPKTQSSLLEAMGEHQATIDGETITLPKPFFVIATQNPIDNNHGTFPLPEAQLDRFLFKLEMAYPSFEEEKSILETYRIMEPLDNLETELSLETIAILKQKVKEIEVTETVVDYMLHIARLTREHADIEVGISTRAVLGWMRACQARAFIKGRSYITPDDAKNLMMDIFGHRLVLTMEAALRKTTKQVVQELVKAVDVPVELEVKE
ncbi:MoxR family ATPase [Aquibacillus koreensis]|uniref:MoxR family ATPase n=1 Tax=Aquibacillus koreensis TaxID=279446 RepID=A0A9X3WMJ8_9BACI|nr:MoxR family ATPase [Aquibacillus koreensis]MCT2535711.1 MoxR family ATPase [Aquibacillus koreensis]MDC3420004.1 MoxR family ATPase [Aquibacillus koreensis]